MPSYTTHATCAGRESNPYLTRGRGTSCHWTTNAKGRRRDLRPRLKPSQGSIFAVFRPRPPHSFDWLDGICTHYLRIKSPPHICMCFEPSKPDAGIEPAICFIPRSCHAIATYQARADCGNRTHHLSLTRGVPHRCGLASALFIV